MHFSAKQHQPKTAIAIISGTGKLKTDCKFGQYIHRVHPNKSPLKILEKRERGHRVPPNMSRERIRQRTSNFVCTFTGSIGTKAH